MSTFSSSSIGRIAIAIAVVELIGLVFITLFYSIGGLFGPLNDLCVGLGGILSGGLAWMLYPMHRSHAPRLSRFTLGAALIGACIAPVGSGLVILRVTGWFFAGLVTTFGYSLIGLWLLALSYSALRWRAFPRRLAQLGIIAGAITAIGLLASPGILVGTDAINSAQWFVLASMFLGGLGWAILYTIWCMWLGRLLASQRLDLQGAIIA